MCGSVLSRELVQLAGHRRQAAGTRAAFGHLGFDAAALTAARVQSQSQTLPDRSHRSEMMRLLVQVTHCACSRQGRGLAAPFGALYLRHLLHKPCLPWSQVLWVPCYAPALRHLMRTARCSLRGSTHASCDSHSGVRFPPANCGVRRTCPWHKTTHSRTASRPDHTAHCSRLNLVAVLKGQKSASDLKRHAAIATMGLTVCDQRARWCAHAFAKANRVRTTRQAVFGPAPQA